MITILFGSLLCAGFAYLSYCSGSIFGTVVAGFCGFLVIGAILCLIGWSKEESAIFAKGR